MRIFFHICLITGFLFLNSGFSLASSQENPEGEVWSFYTESADENGFCRGMLKTAAMVGSYLNPYALYKWYHKNKVLSDLKRANI